MFQVKYVPKWIIVPNVKLFILLVTSRIKVNLKRLIYFNCRFDISVINDNTADVFYLKGLAEFKSAAY